MYQLYSFYLTISFQLFPTSEFHLHVIIFQFSSLILIILLASCFLLTSFVKDLSTMFMIKNNFHWLFAFYFSPFNYSLQYLCYSEKWNESLSDALNISNQTGSPLDIISCLKIDFPIEYLYITYFWKHDIFIFKIQ